MTLVFAPHIVLPELEETQPACQVQPATAIVLPHNKVLVCPYCGEVWGKILIFGTSGLSSLWRAAEAVCPEHLEHNADAGSLLQWECRWINRKPTQQNFGPKIVQREVTLALQHYANNQKAKELLNV